MIDDEHLLDAQLAESFAMYDELIVALTGDDLARKLPVPSNTIGAQLWCVVGARESWARAIEKGSWDGFACTLSSFDDLDAMRQALISSATAVRSACDAASHDPERTDLKLRLLVHESQHQGQLLRYLLGLKLPVPPRWRQRFALTDTSRTEEYLEERAQRGSRRAFDRVLRKVQPGQVRPGDER